MKNRKLIISLLVCVFVLGCSAGAKKTSYDRSGPWTYQQSDGTYKRTQILIDKYGKSYGAKDTKTVVETYPTTQMFQPSKKKRHQTIVITMEGDKVVIQEDKK